MLYASTGVIASYMGFADLHMIMIISPVFIFSTDANHTVLVSLVTMLNNFSKKCYLRTNKYMSYCVVLKV